jgi:hypothetical protein
MTGNSFARGLEISACKGHGAKMAVTSRSVVHHVVIADDDITRRKFYSAMLHPRLIFCGEEADHPATGSYPAGVDFRELLIEPLHPELIKVDLRQLCAEFSSRRGKKLNICGPNSRLIGKWIRKSENFAPRHSRSPGVCEAEKIARLIERPAMSCVFPYRRWPRIISWADRDPRTKGLLRVRYCDRQRGRFFVAAGYAVPAYAT